MLYIWSCDCFVSQVLTWSRCKYDFDQAIFHWKGKADVHVMSIKCCSHLQEKRGGRKSSSSQDQAQWGRCWRRPARSECKTSRSLGTKLSEYLELTLKCSVECLYEPWPLHHMLLVFFLSSPLACFLPWDPSYWTSSSTSSFAWCSLIGLRGCSI